MSLHETPVVLLDVQKSPGMNTLICLQHPPVFLKEIVVTEVLENINI